MLWKGQNVVVKCMKTCHWNCIAISILAWGSSPYIECCARKEVNGIALLLAGVSKLKGIKKKQEYAFLAGDEDVKHVLLSCSVTRKGEQNI